VGLTAALLLTTTTATAAPPTGSDANQPSTWVSYLKSEYGINAECYKHEGTGQTVHGTATSKTVTLAPYGQDWFGDGYALLVIKAGTVDQLTIQPAAGVPYASPQNKDISHWIICKGETPPASTTTLPTTSTSVPPTATSSTSATVTLPLITELAPSLPALPVPVFPTFTG